MGVFFFFFIFLISQHRNIFFKYTDGVLFSGRFNSIRNLHDRSLAGLRRVELLMLHSNDLHHLPDAAFKDMKSLQVNRKRRKTIPLTFLTGVSESN